MDIAQIERKKYRAVWKHEQYRKHSPALKHVQKAIDGLGMKFGHYMYDFGIGTGRAAMQFRDYGLFVQGIDIADNCLDPDCDIYTSPTPLWELSWYPHHYGFCCDVMEHIPTEKVTESLKRIAAHVKKGCYFVISTVDEPHGQMLIGEPLHVTVKPAEWWKAELEKHFGECKITVSDNELTAICFKE